MEIKHILNLESRLKSGCTESGRYTYEDRPVGFLVIREYKTILYLAYLAVDCALRSKGIGGSIADISFDLELVDNGNNTYDFVLKDFVFATVTIKGDMFTYTVEGRHHVF